MTAFNAWLESQVSQGLTELHISVRPAPGCTPDKVRQELLDAESAIAAGRLREPPRARSSVPAEVTSFIGRVSL